MYTLQKPFRFNIILMTKYTKPDKSHVYGSQGSQTEETARSKGLALQVPGTAKPSL